MSSKMKKFKSKAGRTNSSKTATSSKMKKIQVDPESKGRSNEQFKDGHEFEDKKNSSRSGKSKAGRTNSLKTAMSFREGWVLWRTFSIGKWRVNVFKAIHTFEEFKDDHEFQRRLHFREDWVLWRTFSIGKWRVNVFKHTTWLAKRLWVPRQKKFKLIRKV